MRACFPRHQRAEQREWHGKRSKDKIWVWGFQHFDRELRKCISNWSIRESKRWKHLSIVYLFLSLSGQGHGHKCKLFRVLKFSWRILSPRRCTAGSKLLEQRRVPKDFETVQEKHQCIGFFLNSATVSILVHISWCTCFYMSVRCIHRN